MGIVFLIQEAVAQELNKLYGIEIGATEIQVSETKPEFKGDYTVVLFALTKQLKKSPEILGKELGEQLATQHSSRIDSFNVIKGFLNLTVADDFWLQFLTVNYSGDTFGRMPSLGKK